MPVTLDSASGSIVLLSSGLQPQQAGAGAVVGGVLVALWFFYTLYVHLRLQRMGVVTDGTVVSSELGTRRVFQSSESGGSGGYYRTVTTRKIVIRFATAAGEEVDYKTSADTGTVESLAMDSIGDVGSTVSIRYDPARPRRAELADGPAAWTRIGALFVIAAVLVVLGIVLLTT